MLTILVAYSCLLPATHVLYIKPFAWPRQKSNRSRQKATIVPISPLSCDSISSLDCVPLVFTPLRVCTFLGAQSRSSNPLNSLLSSHRLSPLTLTYHVTDVQPRVRWGIVFSMHNYVIIYLPHSLVNIVYCLPIITSCVKPGNQQGHQAAIQPPVIYMLLSERLNPDDDSLRQKFDLSIPLGDPSSSSSSLRSRYDVQ